MNKIWKQFAVVVMVLAVVGAGTVLTAQEHQHEATQEESGHDMDSMESGHDMGAMMAMMKEMVAGMHKHMAMMHAMMKGMHGEGTHGEGMEGMHGEGMEGMHGEGMEGMHGEGMEGMHGEGTEGMHGEGMEGMRKGGGMQGMMNMPDPAGIEDAAEATAQADKLAKHLDMMKMMMPKVEAQIEALRQRAQELSADGS